MADSITHLAELARTCRACPPWAQATQTVFGAGDPHAKIMLVGEQPGDEEDVKGQPFVGPAGRLLDRTLHGAGIDRRHVYVTNALKHSPHAPFVFATLHPSALLRLRDETERGSVRPFRRRPGARARGTEARASDRHATGFADVAARRRAAPICATVPAMEHVDVLIVGAGLSGIGAACHLRRRCPDRTAVILEGRDRSGGTWDLFRYPGVRSDSDMYTLGYAFRPWTRRESIASGPNILQYLRDTAAEEGVDTLTRYQHKVVRAAWSTADARWTLAIERDGQPAAPMTCNFLFLCCGYYRYDAGYLPRFEGVESFAGQIVHPQQWTPDIAWKGKRVVVIGSGATAMTLVPTLADDAAHVTMVQRSPTWVAARPTEDPLARAGRRFLPQRLLHGLLRWKQILLGAYFFHLCRHKPTRARQLLLAGVRAGLGPQFDIDRDFVPRYNPWEQRLCLLLDGDLFRAMRAGRVSVVTDEVERFTPGGLALRSGRTLDADLIVTATGLELQVFGGIALVVDGRAVDPAQTYSYKGVMFSGIPNFASIFGYSNASWTLKSDLAAGYVCRLLNTMRRNGYVQCTPRPGAADMQGEPWIDFSSGYLVRAQDRFPKQGSELPWRMQQNYLRDIALLRFGRIEDGALEFRGASPELARVAA